MVRTLSYLSAIASFVVVASANPEGYLWLPNSGGDPFHGQPVVHPTVKPAGLSGIV